MSAKQWSWPNKLLGLNDMSNPTTVICVRPDGIPTVLQERPQWVVWRREERGGSYTKVPYNPRTRQRAKANDPRSWSSYEACFREYNENPSLWDGIGFVFSVDDPFAGIDLDGVRDAVTGEFLPWSSGLAP